MDRAGHEPFTVASTPHNLDGIQNAIYPPQFDSSYYQATTTEGLDQSWASSRSINPAAAHSITNYNGDWQQNITPQNDAYKRPVSRGATGSPAAAAQQAYLSQYQNIRPQINAANFDPALTGHDGATEYLAANNHLYHGRASPGFTVAPNVLQNTSGTQQSMVKPSVNQKALIAAIPAGLANGQFVIIDQEKLANATTTKRVAAFVNIGQEDFEFAINKTILPATSTRRSRNELRKLAAGDPKLLAKLGKKIGRKVGGITASKQVSKPATLSKPTQRSIREPSSSDSDSSDSDSEDDYVEPSPLPAKRPEDDPKAAVRYDTIEALWRPKKKVLSTPDIRNGLKHFWEVVSTIRDRWKQDQNAVKAAEEKEKKGELPLLKSRVKDQRDMIEAALSAAREHGHREILELSSENVPFLFLCYQFLQDAYTRNDVNSTLTRSILGIMSSCITLTEEKLTKTYLVKALPKIAKKGDADIQSLLQKINADAKEGSKRAAEEQKEMKPIANAAPKIEAKASATKINTEAVAGTKRTAPSSAVPSQPAKRVASGPTTVESVAGAGKTNTTVKKPMTSLASTKVAPGAPTATKTKTTVAKPSNFFNAMQATTKKTLPAAKPAAASIVATALKAAEKKVPVSAAPEAPTAPSMSFASLMANINKPEEKPSMPKNTEIVVVETAEQKQKRLRKQARRSLRVTFKPDSALEEIRYFTHDPEEEFGHSANMKQDASDLGNEGRMFKQHKDVMDIDEDDDDIGDDWLKSFREPSLVNFDEVDAEERERNFAPYGGGSQQPDSPEKASRHEYEANTLMVFYADVSDIPGNPKEPADDMDVEEPNTAREFGAPQEATLQRAIDSAKSINIETKSATTSATPDIASILSALQPQAQATPAQAPSQTPDLATLLASFQPQPQPPPAPVPPQNSAPDLSAILAGLQQNQQPPQPVAQPQNQNGQPDLAALFAAMSQGNGTMPAPPAFPGFPAGFPGMPGMPGMPSFPFHVPSMSNQNQIPQQYGQGGFQPDNDDRNQDPSKKKKTGPWVDKKFTQPCKYWSSGRCQKGSKCTYLHE